MLEAAQYESNAFVTLTYSEESLATGNPLASLVPKHAQDWLKRLRKTIAPARIRFYLVGEYGDATWRPHYHVALFNFPTCVRGRTRRRPGSGRPIWDGCCPNCELVGSTWTHGDVDLGMLETSSAQYVAGYVTKKLTHRDDARLKGREPEFARMSNRPGIGGDALHEVADAFLTFNLEKTQTDVPVSLRHGSRELPLGRYLRRRLRKMVGRDEKTPQAILDQLKEEMRPVREAAFDASQPLRTKIVEVNAGKIANFHSRQKIFKGKRNL